MKVSAFSFVAALFSLNAFAETLPVEFQECSSNRNYVCALVYGAHGGEEMGVTSSPEINDRINRLIRPHGRSLARNIDGRVITSKPFLGSGKVQKLEVLSLEASDPSAPRPRGLSLPRGLESERGDEALGAPAL